MASNSADRTFDPVSQFGSLRWVAATMGLSVDQLRPRLPKMNGDGFPKPDQIVKLYIKADVLAWIERRRQLPVAPERQSSIPRAELTAAERQQIIDRV